MSPSHRDHRGRGSLGTTLLAGACCAGAAAYAVVVGPSMLPAQEDVQITSALSPDIAGLDPEPQDTGQEAAPRGPVGRLQIQVSDRDRAWVQTLECTGTPEEDPAACAELARAAAEFQGEGAGAAEQAATASERAALDEGGAAAEPTAASATGSGYLFTEVREGTVCTDKVYGPQEATVTGTWEGQEVETTLNRKGSCEEARWQRLRAITDQVM